MNRYNGIKRSGPVMLQAKVWDELWALQYLLRKAVSADKTINNTILIKKLKALASAIEEDRGVEED